MNDEGDIGHFMNSSKFIPDFFIVGAPKCGTTALDYYLSQHPDIYMSPAKQLGIENNHFATDLLPLDDPYRSDEKYHALFEKAGNEKILGESSVYHLFSKEAAVNIFRFNPEAKIIIMLRNPVEMLESYHAQLIYNGDEDIMDFDKALQAEENRKNGRLKIRPGLRFNERLFYREVATFSEQICRYRSVFPAGQILTIIYDDFKSDTASVLKATLEFLDVDAAFKTDLFPVNTRKKFPRSTDAADRKSKKIGFAARTYFKKLFTFTNSAGCSDAAAEKTVNRRLKNEYRMEIEKLGTLLNRHLGHWYK